MRKEFFRINNPIHANRIRAYVATQMKEDAKYLMSFTADRWSSDINSDVLRGFTAHWVDGNFQWQSAVLRRYRKDIATGIQKM